MGGVAASDHLGVSVEHAAGARVSPLRDTVRRVPLLAAAMLLPAACGSIAPLPDTPAVPAAALGTNGDVDQAAAAIAGWAFADPSHTDGRPVEAARAVIALEYMSGELSSSPRYAGVSPLHQRQLLDARQEVREALGIAPGAPSQAVVNAMIGVESSCMGDNIAGEKQALTGPAFILGPDATLQRLVSLPSLPLAKVATARAQFDTQPGPF